MAAKKEKVLVLCAHNDDNIIGAGGTIAKYSKAGIDVITVIFSFGEKSHPHLKENIIINTRVKESDRAKGILGEKEIIYLGLKEGHLREGAKDSKIQQKLKEIIIKTNPSKIFTHSINDMHPDHKDVLNIITDILDKMDYMGEVYSFDVWTPITMRKRGAPKLVVDISKTFNKKVKAFKAHKSQWTAQLMLMWSIYAKAIFNGRNNGTKYAEVFYKIR